MIVFHLPSWYPNKFYRIQGIFIKEYITTAARLGNNVHFVSNQRELSVPISKDIPLESLRNFIRYFSYPRESLIRYSDNYMEYSNRNIDADPRFYPWKTERLIQLHRTAFEKACKTFGKIDLIHAHVSYPGGFIASELSEYFSVPFIVSEQMSPFPLTGYRDNKKIKQRIIRTFQKAAIATCLSTPHQDAIYQFTDIKPRVVPNLVDEAVFRPLAINVKSSKYVFFTLCLMSDQKGIQDLLHAIKMAVDEVPNARFRIGGDGPKLEEYKLLAGRLGVTPYVEWLGFVDKKQAVNEFNKACCFVLPSKHESMGVVFAEALACGIPVIATRCGGPEDFVDETCGILTEVGDIKMIAESIVKIARDELVFEKEHLRRHFLDRFSTKVIVDKFDMIYREVLETTILKS